MHRSPRDIFQKHFKNLTKPKFLNGSLSLIYKYWFTTVSRCCCLGQMDFYTGLAVLISLWYLRILMVYVNSVI